MVTLKRRKTVLAVTGSVPEWELSPDLRRLRIETLLLEAKAMVTRDGSGGLRSDLRQTHTYAILEVAPETYADVRARIIKAVGEEDAHNYYLGTDGGAEIIILSTIALKAEK